MVWHLKTFKIVVWWKCILFYHEQQIYVFVNILISDMYQFKINDKASNISWQIQVNILFATDATECLLNFWMFTTRKPHRSFPHEAISIHCTDNRCMSSCFIRHKLYDFLLILTKDHTNWYRGCIFGEAGTFSSNPGCYD